MGVHGLIRSALLWPKNYRDLFWFYLHKVVVDASQAVGSADVLLLVPLVHERALVLHPEPPALVLARHQHGLADLRVTSDTSQRVKINQERSACVTSRHQARFEAHLLYALRVDAVLAELLVDEDEGEEVAHPAVEQLIREAAGALHHCLVILQQPGRAEQPQ